MRCVCTLKKSAWAIVWVTLLVISTVATSDDNGAGRNSLARLKIHNNFKSPDEVVKYYVSRDAHGFVWSGLLALEREAFTTWESVPSQDSFYLARSYKIGPAQIKDEKSAVVEVEYSLRGVSDAYGSFSPAYMDVRKVQFELERREGTWKIVKPEPTTLAPVVLETTAFGKRILSRMPVSAKAVVR